jgi:hypothetical protein
LDGLSSLPISICVALVGRYGEGCTSGGSVNQEKVVYLREYGDLFTFPSTTPLL